MVSIFTKPHTLLIFILLSYFGVKSQENNYLELPPVKLEMKPKALHERDFLLFTEMLTNDKDFKFRKEIKLAKKQGNTLYFYTDTRVYYISKVEYLKKLRRATNRSETPTEFFDRIRSYYPELESVPWMEFNFHELYTNLRKNTLHGYLHTLSDEF